MENVNSVAQEIVKVAVNPEDLAKANEELLNKAIAETVSALPAAQTKPATSTWKKNLLIGGTTLIGGIALGAATEKWVVPAISKKIDQWKVKRAAKKAAKAAKKAAAKAADQAQKPQVPVLNTNTTGADDPNAINVEIKD